MRDLEGLIPLYSHIAMAEQGPQPQYAEHFALNIGV